MGSPLGAWRDFDFMIYAMRPKYIDDVIFLSASMQRLCAVSELEDHYAYASSLFVPLIRRRDISPATTRSPAVIDCRYFRSSRLIFEDTRSARRRFHMRHADEMSADACIF